MPQRIEIAYGPVGQKGVTHMMAVGAADFDEGAADRAMRRGLWLAGGLWLTGWLLGSTRVRSIALGAGGALWLARRASRPGMTEAEAARVKAAAGWR